MKATILICALLLHGTIPARAAEPKTAPPRPRATGTSSLPPLPQVRSVGNVYVGDAAPDFQLTSSRMRDIRLSSLRGEWIVLHFVSAREEFAGMKAEQESLEQLGLKLLGVCKDPPQALRAIARREDIGFEMLADPTGEVSAMYGLYDAARSRSRPGFLILDRQGTVRLALFGDLPSAEVVNLARFTMTVGGS